MLTLIRLRESGQLHPWMPPPWICRGSPNHLSRRGAARKHQTNMSEPGLKPGYRFYMDHTKIVLWLKFSEH